MDVGRNDPCPCGSGKKYKKCCMDKATESETSRTEDMERTEHLLREKLQEFLMREEFRDDLSNAWMLFWNEEDTSSMKDIDKYKYSTFAEWLIHEYRLNDHDISLIELFYNRKKNKLQPDELSMLKDWLKAFYGVFEVQKVVLGKGTHIKDIFSQDEIFLNDVTSSNTLLKYDILIYHILPMSGKYYGSGCLHRIPPLARQNLLSYLDQKLQEHLADNDDALTMDQFVRNYPYYLNHFVLDFEAEKPEFITPEGNVICFSNSCFKVNDYSAVEAFFQENSDKFKFMGADEKMDCLRFDYLAPYDKENIKGRNKEGDKTLMTQWIDDERKQYSCLGNLTLTRKMLNIECTSKERLDSLKKRLSPLENSGAILNIGTTYKDVSHALKRSESEKEQGDIPEDVEIELSKEFLEKYTRDWLDMQIPALNNMTPRQAAKTEQGRMQLKEMLKDMDNLYEHHKKQGRPYMNVPLIKKTLGID